VRTGIWWGNLRDRDRLEDKGVEGDDNIKMDLLVVGCGGMDWIYYAQKNETWLGSCECGNEPQEFHKTWGIS